VGGGRWRGLGEGGGGGQMARVVRSGGGGTARVGALGCYDWIDSNRTQRGIDAPTTTHQ